MGGIEKSAEEFNQDVAWNGGLYLQAEIGGGLFILIWECDDIIEVNNMMRGHRWGRQSVFCLG